MHHKCEHCGAEVGVDHKFCFSCGGKLIEKKCRDSNRHCCPRCGHHLNADEEYCRECETSANVKGISVDSKVDESAERDVDQKKNDDDKIKQSHHLLESNAKDGINGRVTRDPKVVSVEIPTTSETSRNIKQDEENEEAREVANDGIDTDLNYASNIVTTALEGDLEKMSVNKEINVIHGVAKKDIVEKKTDLLVDNKSGSITSGSVDNGNVIQHSLKGHAEFKDVENLEMKMNSLDLKSAEKRQNQNNDFSELADTPKKKKKKKKKRKKKKRQKQDDDQDSQTRGTMSSSDDSDRDSIKESELEESNEREKQRGNIESTSERKNEPVTTPEEERMDKVTMQTSHEVDSDKSTAENMSLGATCSSDSTIPNRNSEGAKFIKLQREIIMSCSEENAVSQICVDNTKISQNGNKSEIKIPPGLDNQQDSLHASFTEESESKGSENSAANDYNKRTMHNEAITENNVDIAKKPNTNVSTSEEKIVSQIRVELVVNTEISQEGNKSEIKIPPGLDNREDPLHASFTKESESKGSENSASNDHNKRSKHDEAIAENKVDRAKKSNTNVSNSEGESHLMKKQFGSPNNQLSLTGTNHTHSESDNGKYIVSSSKVDNSYDQSSSSTSNSCPVNESGTHKQSSSDQVKDVTASAKAKSSNAEATNTSQLYSEIAKKNTGGTKPNEDQHNRTGGHNLRSTAKTNAMASLVSAPSDAHVIVVHFHVLLHPNFLQRYSNAVRVQIVFGYPIGNWGFDSPIVAKEIGRSGAYLILRGQIHLPLSEAHKSIMYKYVLVTKDKKSESYDYHWEFIFEPVCIGADKFVMNRCLKLPEIARDTGEWHKYDDVICGRPADPANFFKRTWQYFAGKNDDSIPNFKFEFEHCFRVYFPRWQGFYDHKIPVDKLECNTAAEGCDEIINRAESFRNSHFQEPGQYYYRNRGEIFDFPKGILTILQPRIVQNSILSLEEKPTLEIQQDRLISGLAIAHILRHFLKGDVGRLSDEVLSNLLAGLSVEFLAKKGMDKVMFSGLILQKFGTKYLSHLIETLQIFCKIAIENGLAKSSPLWWNAVALVHLIAESNTEKIQTQGGDKKDDEDIGNVDGVKDEKLYIKWYQVDLPLKRIYSYKNHRGDSRLLRTTAEAIPQMGGMLRLDPLLQKTILYFCKLEDFHKFIKTGHLDVVNVVCALCLIIRQLTTVLSKEVETLSKYFELLVQQVAIENATGFLRWKKSLNSCFELLVQSLKKIMNAEKCPSYFKHLTVLISEITKKAFSLHPNCIETLLEIIDKASKGFFVQLGETVSIASRYFSCTKDCLVVLDCFLGMDFGIDVANKKWVTGILAIVQNLLQKVSRNDEMKILDIICQAGATEYSQHLNDKLSEAADNLIEKLATNVKSDDVFNAINSAHISVRKRSLLLDFLARAWPENAKKGKVNNSDVVRHVLSWRAMHGFIQFYGEEIRKGKLGGREDGEKLLCRAVECVRSVTTELKVSTLTVDVLRIIHENNEQFIKIAVIVSEENDAEEAKALLTHLTNQRWNNLISFMRKTKEITLFVQLCKTQNIVSVDIHDTEQKLEDDIQFKRMIDLYITEDDHQKEVYFNLDERLEEAIPTIHKLSESRLFRMFWEKQFHGLSGIDEAMSAVDIVERIWTPAEVEMKELIESLSSEEISLRRVENIFKEYEGKSEILFHELSLLNETLNEDADISWIKQVIEKIIYFFSLQNSQSNASCILEVGRMLNLKGDFSAFQEIVHQMISDKDKKLKNLSDTLVEATRALTRIPPEMQKCLKPIAKCVPLINWLREELKGPRDVKTFVDLLSISAGESDYEADRVSCLHTCCVDFEPIIFYLNEKSGPEEIISACEKILAVLKKDPDVLNKLIDSNRNLEWFKNARKSYGSVATSSMMEAEKANRKGVYVLGTLSSLDGIDCANDPVTSLNNSLRLFVGEFSTTKMELDLNRKDIKGYNLDEIRDLQSKLMLIGGKQGKAKELGQIEKDCFIRMFEAVSRLAYVYVDLCKAGDSRYIGWRKEFKCCLDKGNDYFDGAISDIEEICKIMEGHLNDWKKILHSKRWTYPNLNYFTVRQLVFLQRTLFGLFVKPADFVTQLPVQVFTLLECIYPNISREILKNTILSSSYEIKYGHVTDDNKSWEKLDQPGSRFDQVSLETIIEIISQLESDGLTYDAAMAALNGCGADDVDEAAVWYSENDGNDEVLKRLSDEMKEILEKKEEESTQHIASESAEFMDAYSYDESKSQTEEDEFLSLDDLGKLLEELAKQKNRRRMKRNTPEFLSSGKPNLILVPRDDIFLMLLGMYKSSSDSLPTASEVLVCNETTTAEEVELLYRRALNDPNGLYTLAFADEIGYNVSEQSFMKLEKLLKEMTERDSTAIYNLVVICSSEHEDTSYLASALDNYRVVSPPSPPQQSIQEFLRRQFASNKSARTSVVLQSAAEADIEGYSVRVIKSRRAGIGKSLYVSRIGSKLESLMQNSKHALRQVFHSVDTNLVVTTPLHGNEVNQDKVVKALLPYEKTQEDAFPRIYHFDIASTITTKLDSFIFNLLILGAISTPSGRIWRRKPADLYILEVTETGMMGERSVVGHPKQKTLNNLATVIPLLPAIQCWSPHATYAYLRDGKPGHCRHDPMFDEQEFKSVAFQRVYQYLKVYSSNVNAINTFEFRPGEIRGDCLDCLRILLRYCGVPDPSWREITHFVHFLSNQLSDSENSVFCDMTMNADTLRGFKTFVVKFMLQMAKDFATPSLEEQDTANIQHEGLVALRRRWEMSPHPYLFFNQDRVTMTFVGFNIARNGDLLDPQSRTVLERRMINSELVQGLQRQGVDLLCNYDRWPRDKRLYALSQVMGLDFVFDPDETYELTMDNVMKILAIHMRFRSGIPVILMGETGCGKTRLIRFMCALKAGPGGPRNMLLVKVHGGVTEDDIRRRVQEAKVLAKENRAKNPNLETILFFDEANTTNAVGLIKEIMCDHRVCGEPLELASYGLQIISACNPYRKHSNDMIQKLESAGLGYHVKADETFEKLGHIPLRQLVYRVHQLSESMLPLVWDFGQLTTEIEELYAKQIVHRYARNGEIPRDAEFLEMTIKILARSQEYMRSRKDECSFVSLRDVERTVQVLSWFGKRMDTFLSLIDANNQLQRPWETMDAENEEEDDSENEEEDSENQEELLQTKNVYDKNRIALVLSIGVCYCARLEERDDYLECIRPFFRGNYKLGSGIIQLKREIQSCQQMFLSQLQLDDNIAKNTALCENVFMMVICTELRIPLFVVGKPGSSKSLAKTIILDNMQGNLSPSDLFKNFKQILMCSYQCSPLSTAEGIIGTFRQCSRFQEGKNLDTFTSVVVLDEVGLAEDSPRMPLKALHPLLEDGTDGSEDLTAEGSDMKSKRVAFIGISNWALDPAKMNRGIMLTRGQPDKDELVTSAEGICASEQITKAKITGLFRPLANAYDKVYEKQKGCERLKRARKEEFFGLRDYYSLIKMIFGFAKKSEGLPSNAEIKHAVKRNFGGLEELDIWEIFKEELLSIISKEDNLEERSPGPDCTPLGLIHSSLSKTTHLRDSRYLLIMTENYAALKVLKQMFLSERDDVMVIFGSSFPKDQEFTQICRDINRIKVCMETGKTVVLLNMENLYESLYDALNQYYVYLGGQRYVDLGLGTHRVKCRVHEDFKLIVIAEKNVVYDSFPIPLINRLEKHFLIMSTSMKTEQLEMCKELDQWAESFATVSSGRQQFEKGDSFIGYNEDTAATIVLEAIRTLVMTDGEEVLEQSQGLLLQCATPESLARLHKTSLRMDADRLWRIYFHQQHHSSLIDYLNGVLPYQPEGKGISVQVTTFSRLLSPHDQLKLEQQCDLQNKVKCISLNQFQTEQQFSEGIGRFFKDPPSGQSMLIIQCDNGDDKANLIACARHLCENSKNIHLLDVSTSSEDVEMTLSNTVHIAFIVQLKRVAGGCKQLGGFHGGNWLSVHIDELRPPTEDMPSLIDYADRPISSLFEVAKEDSHSQLLLPIGLLKRCVQPAVAELNQKEGGSNAERVIKRIKELLKLLSEAISSEDLAWNFVITLIGHIHKVLLEKEQGCVDIDEPLTSWLFNEAIEGRNIQECGTFRRTLSYRIERDLIPILALVISKIDQHNNLDLLTEESWKQMLWMQLFQCREIVSVTSEDVKQFQAQQLRQGNMQLACWFPFSAALRTVMDEHFKIYYEEGMEFDALDKIEKALSQTSAGELLWSLEQPALMAYLRDLIYLEFTIYNINVHELLARAVHSIVQQISTKMDTSPNIVSLHYVINHSFFRQRLKCFLMIAEAIPDIMSKVKEGIPETGDCVLDGYTLHICLDYLTPDIDELTDEQNRFIWCNKVQSVKVATNQLLDLVAKHKEECSERLLSIIDNCRITWTRLQIMRMFVEHVCPPGIPFDKRDLYCALELWKILQDLQDDLSSVSSWRIIQDFLRKAISDKKQTTGNSSEDIDDIDECIICLDPLDDPVELPCYHVVCFNCISKWMADSQDACLVCHADLPSGFKIQESKQNREITFQVGEFQRRCTAFFMELVSNFCFAREKETAIHSDIIELMMSYVTKEHAAEEATKQFSPYTEYAVDPTPVVRSYILQQLLRTSNTDVKTYLKRFLKDSQQFITRYHDIVELCILFVYCIEDHHLSNATKMKELGIKRVLILLIRKFETSIKTLSSPNCPMTDVASLEAVAELRVAFKFASDLLYQHASDDTWFENFDGPTQKKLRQLFELLCRACTSIQDVHPRFFFLRQLLRNYGSGDMRMIVQKEEFTWLWSFPGDDSIEEAMADKFVVYGDRYKVIRDTVGEYILKAGSEDLINALTTEGDISKDLRDVYLLLSLYREVTTLYGKNPPSNEVIEAVLESIKGSEYANILNLADELLHNRQAGACRYLDPTTEQFPLEREMADIVIHTIIVLCSQHHNVLVQPLGLLALNPNAMRQSYLPTMPDDHLTEAMDVGIGQTYQCPNGHPYVVGDCGLPTETRRCFECNAEIGGKDHISSTGNVLAKRVDRTLTGHILGNPARRLKFPIPERGLSRPSVSILRFIMHACMLKATCENSQSIATIIDPAIRAANASEFVWEHLQQDLQDLASSLGKSKDDAAIALHMVLQQVLTATLNLNGNEDFKTLGSRECRRQWEDSFDEYFIKPVLARLATDIPIIRNTLLNDKRLGANPVMRQLYELDISDDDADIDVQAHSCPRLWCYRSQVTVNHLQNALKGVAAIKGRQICVILNEFLQKEDRLRWVRFLPDIVRLQNILTTHLSRRLDNSHAKKSPIKEVIDNYLRGDVQDDAKRLLPNYFTTWKAIRPFLSSHGSIRIPETETEVDLSSNTQASYFFPTYSGPGLCALAMTYFLASTHNDFMEKCKPALGLKFDQSKVAIAEVTQAHLVAYDHDRDFLPMVYAHCDYSLEIGKGTEVTYNLPALERQLMETFVHGKPHIDIKIQSFAYREDVNSFEKQTLLKQKVPQTMIPFAEQRQMLLELHELSEVCDSLRAIEIAIGFLISTGADPNRFYKEYLEEVLCMQPAQYLASGKMQSSCRLTHCLSMWLMLSVERACRLFNHGQEPFETQSYFQDDLDENESEILKHELRHVDVDHLLADLSEYITLELPLRKEKDKDFSVLESLQVYSDRKRVQDVKGIEKLPQEICLRNIIHLWKIVARVSEKHRVNERIM